MKKRLIAILACVCLVAGLLAACSSSSTTTTAAATEAATTAAASAETEAAASSQYEQGQFVLTVTQHDPEASATGTFLNAWAERVEEASGGAIDVQVYHGGTIAGPKDSIDAVKNGTVDIAWGLQSFYDGMFDVTSTFMLPLLDISSAPQGSTALWNFYNDHPEYFAEEYADYHVLFLHTNCQSPISLSAKSSVQKIEKIEDFAGLNIRGNAGPPNIFLPLLGANVVGCSINDLYKNLETAEFDGCLTDWHGISSFKLDEVIGSYLDENIGVSTYFMLMNPDSYAALPEDLQKILDETTAACADLTAAWDEVEASIKAEVSAKCYKLSDEERAKLEAAAAETETQWIAKLTEEGYDGETIVKEVKEYVAAAK